MRAAVQPVPVPERRFTHVHMDLVGPFTTSSEGHRHIFTMVDQTTRWAGAVTVSGNTTRNCVEAFFRGWVSRFGVPELLTLDRGSQFTSEVWPPGARGWGSSSCLQPPITHRFHRQIKNVLRARLAE